MRLRLFLPLTLATFLLCTPGLAQTQSLDAFDSLSAWHVIASEGVTAHTSLDSGINGRCVRLDYDFHGHGGYCIMHKDIHVDLPEDFRLTYWVKGRSPENNLEFKLIDSSGDNVWWHFRRAFSFPQTWTQLVTRRHHVTFAWGPLGGGPIRSFDAMEFAVSPAQGGKGSLWFDDMRLEQLPPGADSAAPALVGGSRRLVGKTIEIDARPYRMAKLPRPEPGTFVEMRFPTVRELNGLVIQWPDLKMIPPFDVLASTGSAGWKLVWSADRAPGSTSYVFLPDCEARTLRIRVDDPVKAPVAVLLLRSSSAGTANSFFSDVATRERRGFFPKYFLGEQSYWTVVGADGDSDEALLSDEGRCEVRKGGPSLEPFLRVNGRVLTWNDARLSYSLDKGYLPVPSVHWNTESLSLAVTAWAGGKPGASQLHVRYRVTNASPRRLAGDLIIALRPFQVSPPWQNLTMNAGVSEIQHVTCTDTSMEYDDTLAVIFKKRPDRMDAIAFENGDVTSYLSGKVPPFSTLGSSPSGLASALAVYHFELPPRGSTEFIATSPFKASKVLTLPKDFKADLRHVEADWEKRLGGFTLRLPKALGRFEDVLRTQIGNILINRDGPALQPGSRVYERSWIRDGALIAGALLRFGHFDEVREYLNWYTHYQYPDGKVPCVVDRRGADPVPEHDSNGEFLHAIYEFFMFTHDTSFVVGRMDHIRDAVAYLDSLRHLRMTEEYSKPDKLAYRGLLPESISHEGYSAKPMHSYWDDFFALRGLEDAAELGHAVGAATWADSVSRIASEFKEAVTSSLRLSTAEHRIDYVPGCVELGDFDATSTAIAPNLDIDTSVTGGARLKETFDRYFDFFLNRENGKVEWENMTPYELRIANALVRLGERERAVDLLRYFLRQQRPDAWNAWAEVVWRDVRTPEFIGDIPHTWCGAEYMLSLRSLFAYERRRDTALVICAGVERGWLRTDSDVIRVGLPTYFGEIDYTLRKTKRGLRLTLSPHRWNPAARIFFAPPDPAQVTSVSVNGTKTTLQSNGELHLRSFPCTVELTYR